MKKICGLALALTVLLTWNSCNSANSGQFELYMSDLPVGAEKVNVQLSGIVILKSGGGSVTVGETAQTYDLLELQSFEQLIGERTVDATTYSEIRLTVDSASIVISGVTYNMQVTDTEVTVPVSFVVASGKTALVVLDFNADASVTETSPGVFTMTPVVQVKRVSF
jgi:hypothetical protein